MNSIPREVNGKWYPVPCPEGISIGQSFPSYEACLAACETSDAYDFILEDERLEFDEKLGADCEESYERGHEAGYEQGYDVGHDEGEESGRSLGYDAGYADAKEEFSRSAETA